MIETLTIRLQSIRNTIMIIEKTIDGISDGSMFCPEELKKGMVEINRKMVENLEARKEEIEYTLGLIKLQEKSDSLNDSVNEFKHPNNGGWIDCIGEIAEEERGEHLDNLKEAAERTQDINQSKNTGNGCDVFIINQPEKWTPKVGDKVRVKTWEEIKTLTGCEEKPTDCGTNSLKMSNIGFLETMKSLSGRVFEISYFGGILVDLKDCSFSFLPEWLEYLPNES